MPRINKEKHRSTKQNIDFNVDNYKGLKNLTPEQWANELSYRQIFLDCVGTPGADNFVKKIEKHGIITFINNEEIDDNNYKAPDYFKLLENYKKVGLYSVEKISKKLMEKTINECLEKFTYNYYVLLQESALYYINFREKSSYKILDSSDNADIGAITNITNKFKQSKDELTEDDLLFIRSETEHILPHIAPIKLLSKRDASALSHILNTDKKENDFRKKYQANLSHSQDYLVFSGQLTIEDANFLYGSYDEFIRTKNKKYIINNIAHLTLDLDYSDDDLQKVFKSFLTELRSRLGSYGKKRSEREIKYLKTGKLSKTHLQQWVKFKILEYIDLKMIIAQHYDIKINHAAAIEKLFPGDNTGLERKEVARIAKELISSVDITQKLRSLS